MSVYRSAVIKLLNSLSSASTIVTMNTIDPGKTIISFNLADLGLSNADWNTVLTLYPYATSPKSLLLPTIAQQTGTAIPYVRGDWFANNVSHGPIYAVVARLEDTLDKQAAKLHVNLIPDINNSTAQRAGLQQSGVSIHNRIIERHPLSGVAGYFWTTYDFTSSFNVRDVFQHPFGPTGATVPPGTISFHHDAGETIFNLPNGFQGYFINAAPTGTPSDGGKRIDKAAVNIVLDPLREDRAVTNGISCMGCHEQGIRDASDEVKEFVLKTNPPASTLGALQSLYPDNSSDSGIPKLLSGDKASFVSAMKNAGLTNSTLGLTLGDINGTTDNTHVEMINALALKQDVDLTLEESSRGIGSHAR